MHADLPRPRTSWWPGLAAWFLLEMLSGSALSGIAQAAPEPSPPKPLRVVAAPIEQQGRYRHDACLITWHAETGRVVSEAFGIEPVLTSPEECLMMFDRWYYAVGRANR